MNNDQPTQETLLPHAGNYRKLFSCQKAEAIYDITYYFCKNYLQRFDRTIDQMMQAARSGKQNIVEGYAASATSKETEIKLVNVAKASLHELLIDYEDYLRKRNNRQWENGSVELQKMSELGRKHNDTAVYMTLIKTRSPETISNITICLIKQTDYLLFKQLQSNSEDFLKNGGMRERMTRMRLKRKKS